MKLRLRPPVCASVDWANRASLMRTSLRTALQVRSEFRLQGLSIYLPMGLQSACRADFIVAQGNALGRETIVECALKGHLKLSAGSVLRRTFSAQLAACPFPRALPWATVKLPRWGAFPHPRQYVDRPFRRQLERSFSERSRNDVGTCRPYGTTHLPGGLTQLSNSRAIKRG